MPKQLKIGIVGCGAIGSSLAKAIVKDFKNQAVLSALYDIDKNKSRLLFRMLSKSKALLAKGLKELIMVSDLVIETSSSAASFDVCRLALSRGRDVLVMSVGGVAGREKELAALARRRDGHVYIPSGAIAGIDALKAARLSQLKKVTLTTRKHPLSFKGVDYIIKRKINLEAIKKDTALFSGPAEQAIRLFPQNINVAGLLSMAGLGLKRTRVRIIASPAAKRNIHEVKIESSAAKITAQTENILHPDNPKTSFLAVLSAKAVLRQILDPIRIGT